MNRIFTLVIALTLIIAGSNVFAQKPAQSPRRVQQTEAIQYANERSSNVPRYRGYRKPSIDDAPKVTTTLWQNAEAYTAPQTTFALQPVSPPKTKEAAPAIQSSSRRITKITPRPKQVRVEEEIVFSLPIEQLQATEVAPVIHSSSRRITRVEVPTPLTDSQFSAPAATEPTEMQTDVVATKFNSQNFKHRSPSDYVQEDFKQSQWKPRTKQVQSAEEIVFSLPVERLQATEVAPVIHSSSRRITKIEAPTPSTTFSASVPDSIEPTETQTDIVTTRAPAKASPIFNYRIPSDYVQEDFKQSQWKPRPKQVQSAEKVTRSSPDEQLQAIGDQDLFEIVSPAFAEGNNTVAVPSKAMSLEPEEAKSTFFIAETDSPPAVESESVIEEVAPVVPSTSFITETVSPTVETESMIKVVAPVTSAKAELATKAEYQTTNSFHTSAGKESSRQETAAGAWGFFFLPLLALPLLAWLGWTLFGGERHCQFEEAPTIDIPRQRNSTWQTQDSSDAQLSVSGAVEAENCSQGFQSTEDRFFDFKPETEVLDEINSISFIASNSNSTSKSTSNSRAKLEK